MESFTTFMQALMRGDFAHEIIIAVIVVAAAATLSHFVARLVHRLTDIDGVKVASGTLIINIARVLLWGVAIAFILSLFGVNVNALLAAMGVGGIALSLGLQDTIANILGGIQATALKIVKVGDYIMVGGVEGLVQDVTWRQTVVKDIDNIVHIIPNATINASTVSQRTPPLLISVPFSTMGACDDPDALAASMEAAAKPAIEEIGELERDPWVLFYEVGDYGIHGKMRFVMKKPENMREARDAAMRAIIPFLGTQPI